MPRLNIPLHSRKTARPHWRAVWAMFGFLAVLLLTLTTSFLCFTRDSLAKTAPEASYAVFHMSPNKQTWPTILDLGHSIPLIKNYPITINHLAPFIKGELGIFESTTGTTVGFKGKLDLETTYSIEQLGLIITKKGAKTFISEKPVTFTEFKYKPGFVDRLSNKLIGNIYLPGQSTSYPLKISSAGLTLDLKQSSSSNPLLGIPQNTIFSLNLEPNSGNDDYLSGVSGGLIKQNLGLSKSTDSIFTAINQYGGLVELIQEGSNQKSTYFYLSLDHMLPEIEIATIFSELEQTLNPSLGTKELPDESTVTEIIASRNLLDVQKVSLGDYVARIGQNITVINNEHQTIITNAKDIPGLLVSEHEPVPCGKNPFGTMNTENYLEYTTDLRSKYFSNRVSALLDGFVHISLDKKAKTSLFVMCRD